MIVPPKHLSRWLPPFVAVAASLVLLVLGGSAWAVDQPAASGATKIGSFSLQPTQRYVRKEGRLLRVIDATLTVDGPPGPLVFHVQGPGEAEDVKADKEPANGSVDQELLVPDSPATATYQVTAALGSISSNATVKVDPCRKWKIFVAASAHTDIGYTDLQPKVAALHSDNIDRAMALIKQYPDFRWDVEAAWEMENYLADRPEPQRQEYLRCLGEGKMGVQACYANILSGLLSDEGATRLTWAAARAHRLYGVPYDSAMTSDVPSLEASIPTILADSGIRYFSEGMNATHFSPAFRKLNPAVIGAPCWWEGLDGSRVMMVFAPSYYQARILKMDADVTLFLSSLAGDLKKYVDRTDYPYDAIFLHGALGDNMVLGPELATVGAQWNQRYAYPQVIFCNNDAFFQYLESHYDVSKLPVVRGSGGTCWEDGAGSSAQETRLDRQAQEKLTAAEKLLSLASRLNPGLPSATDQINQAWRNCLLYDEHTWGARGSIAHPDDPGTLAQWQIKAQYAIDADKTASELQQRGLQAVVSLVRHDGPALVVVNPSSWPRTEVIRAELPAGLGVAEGGAKACQAGADAGTYLLVKDVPACGYQTIKLASGAPSAPVVQEPPANTLESRFYRVTFDPATGGITSVLDKETGRELVDAQAPYRLNEYLYVSSPAKTDLYRDKQPPALQVNPSQAATFTRSKLGELGERMVVETSAQQTPKISSTVTVWNDVKRVEIENRLTKTQTYVQEAAYFAFPFAAKQPVFRYEIPGGSVRPDKDMMAGACQAWFTVQHFVELDTAAGSITWSSPDAPLVCLQDINRGTWPSPLALTNGSVFSYIMNNYWWTNYKAGQGGDFVFRYAFTSQAQADPAASTRFGAEAAGPLLSLASGANPAGQLTAPAAGLLQVQEPNIVAFGIPGAEVGHGVVLHLQETSGQDTVAHVRISALGAHQAALCNLVETPQSALAISDGLISVPMKAWSLGAVKLE